MLKNNLKKITISLIAIFLVIGVAYTTYATEGNIMDEILNELRQQESGNIVENENAEQIPEGVNNNKPLNVNTNTNTNTNTNLSAGNKNVNENRPASTPHAGLGDYTGLIFVAVFAVSAVYAYKKVREYNA